MKKRIKYAPLEFYRQDKRILTNENWCGENEDGTVTASFIHLSDGLFRVCIWGRDDFGLERDFEIESDALEMFKRVTHLITQDQLRAWGFYGA